MIKILIILYLLFSSLNAALLFEDKSGAYTFEQVSKEEPFKETNKLSYRMTGATYWLKLELENTQAESKRLYVVFAQNSLKKATMYVPKSNGELLVKYTGSDIAKDEKTLPTHTNVFDIRVAANSKQSVYIKTYSHIMVNLEYTILNEEAFIEALSYDYAVDYFILGMLVVLFIYNMFIYIANRDISYAYYLVYLSGIIGFHLFSTNLLWQLVGLVPELPYRMAHHSLSLILIFALLFITKVLYTDVAYRYKNVTNVVLITSIVYFLLGLIYPQEALWYSMLIKYYLLFALYLAFLIIYSFKVCNNPLSIYILIGWSFYFVGMIVTFLTTNGYIKNTFFFDAVIWGSLAEALIFSLVLAYRIKLVEKENFFLHQTYMQDLEDEVRIRTQELKAAKEVAENVSDFKSRFLANMSHEIRTPMNGVLGFLEQLSKTETDPKRMKLFEIIKSSGEQLLSIINDILDFSKIDSGKLEIESAPYDVTLLLENASKVFDQVANKKAISLFLDIDEALPRCIIGDKTRIQQVVYNLLSNAVKFTDTDGEVRLHCMYDQAGSVTIAVKDNGKGISNTKLEHIFEEFAQEDVSTTRNYGGTGLGLSISYKLVELMGGVLQVESEEGRGSNFYFTLPVEICDAASLASKVEAQKEDMPETFQAHVLIVEDNKTNQMLLRMILDDLGFSYEVVNDGVEAVAAFEENHSMYSIILMDENMPNMNGVEATKRIRIIENEKLLDKTPIIAVTANALIQDKQRFLNEGMDDYVAKPYAEKDILKVITKHLAQ